MRMTEWLLSMLEPTDAEGEVEVHEAAVLLPHEIEGNEVEVETDQRKKTFATTATVRGTGPLTAKKKLYRRVERSEKADASTAVKRDTSVSNAKKRKAGVETGEDLIHVRKVAVDLHQRAVAGQGLRDLAVTNVTVVEAGNDRVLHHIKSPSSVNQIRRRLAGIVDRVESARAQVVIRAQSEKIHERGVMNAQSLQKAKTQLVRLLRRHLSPYRLLIKNKEKQKDQSRGRERPLLPKYDRQA